MLGKRIKSARMRVNMSQSELADLCGWDQGRQSHYELGRYEPNIEQIKLIAKNAGCSVSELVGISNEELGIGEIASGDRSVDTMVNNLLQMPKSQRDDILKAISLMIPKKIK